MRAPTLTPLATAVLHLDSPPERALVLAGDAGEAAFFLAREFPTARVRGVDPSEAGVRAAGARIGLDPEGRVAFKRGGGRRVPYPDANFDLVCVLDGSLSPREARRLLRGAGHLVLARTASGPRRARPDSRLLWRRLRLHGIELVVGGEIDGGSFSVGRVAGPGPGGGPV